MAGVTSALCTSFKVELLEGVHDFTLTTGDVFKIALFKPTASIVGTYGAATTNYSDMTGNGDEHTAGGGNQYTTGGNTLTNVTPSADGTTAIIDFADSTWTLATISSCGALIYNSSNGNKAVAVIAFGSDKTSTTGDFTVVMPTAAAATAIVRVA